MMIGNHYEDEHLSFDFSSGRAWLPATAVDRPPLAGPMLLHRSPANRLSG